MKILLVRHGQTNLNNPRRIQGVSNLELNETGKLQAKEVKEKLDKKDIDLIICSPLIRAKQTAEIINKGRNLPIIIDERIIEMNFGSIEGELCKDEFWQIDFDFKSKSGESIEDFLDRIANFIEDTKEKYKEKTVLVVAHGGVARAFRCYFQGIPKNNNIANFGVKNCEVIEYETDK